MDEKDRNTELVEFFKALSNPSRLKIVGLLANRDYTVEELAALLDLSASTVSNHLAFLSYIGLVSARAESYYNIYRLETEHLHDMARRLLAEDGLSRFASDVDLDAYDRKVLQTYVAKDGSLKGIPSQQKKLMVVLRHVVRDFEPGRRYSEREVNDILRRFHQDTADLRRYLIEARLLTRDKAGKEYWRVE
jgi:hypothetical protein